MPVCTGSPIDDPGHSFRAAPMAFATPRADALGLQRAAGIDEAVQFFIEDDLATQKALAE